MKIKNVMSTDIIKISKDASLLDAAKILFQNQISGLLVVDNADNLIGVLSEKDLYRSLYPSYGEFYESPSSVLTNDPPSMIKRAKGKKVSDAMSKLLVVMHEDDPAIKAGALMLAKMINRIPVLDHEGKIVGIVSRRNIYQEIFKKELAL